MGSIDRMLVKWDAQAAPQLRAELERMRSALEAAEARAERAEQEAHHWMDVADNWRDDLLQVIEAAGKQPGLTMEGRIVDECQIKNDAARFRWLLDNCNNSYDPSDDGPQFICPIKPYTPQNWREIVRSSIDDIIYT